MKLPNFNHMRFFYSMFVLLLVIPLRAQVYKGTIDKYPVVFEIMQDDYFGYQARYYYTKVKSDIFLSGKGQGPVFTTNEEDPAKRETFNLKKEGKNLKGSWQKNGKKLSVSLTLADPAKASCNYNTQALRDLKKEDLYGYLKLDNINFKAGKQEQWDNTVFEWFTEPVTGISCFRIKSSNLFEDLKLINGFLLEFHLDQVAAYVSCIDGAPNGGEYSFDCKPVYLSKQLLSIYCTSGYYCGGAHPDAGGWGVTIDCSIVQPLNLSDLYWFDDRKNYVEGVTGNQDDNMSAFDETWNGIVKTHFPDNIGNEGDDCYYGDPSIWSKSTWCLKKDGLYIGTFFPRAIRACEGDDSWPVIPYSDLEKYRVNQAKYILK
jgi:hypothetical protein